MACFIDNFELKKIMPKVGLEPTRPCGLQILSLARLPISPLRPGMRDKYISAKRKKIKPRLNVCEKFDQLCKKRRLFYFSANRRRMRSD